MRKGRFSWRRCAALLSAFLLLAGCTSKESASSGAADPSNIEDTSEPGRDNQRVKTLEFARSSDNDVALNNREPVPSVQKYKDVQLTVACTTGGMSDPLYVDGGEWAKRTGAKLEIIELPFNQLFELVVTDIVSGKASFDVLLYPHYLSGDIMTTGKLAPLEDMLGVQANGSYESGGVEWNSYYSCYNELYSWYNGHVYSLPTDGDVFQVAYRKDLWLRYANEFYAQYGYYLRPDDPTFPETWDQYYDIAEFMNGRNGIFGTVEISARSRSSAWHFLTRYVSYLKKDDMFYGDVYFDRETMKPLINNPAGVRAMEDVIKSASLRYSPPGFESYSWTDLQQMWKDGKCAISFTWPAMANISRREGSLIPGGLSSTGYSMIPGSKEVYDLEQEQWVSLLEPHRATMLAHGWQYSILESARNKEASFDLVRWMVTGDRLIHNTQKFNWEYEPLKKWQWNDPQIIENFASAPSYLSSLQQSFEVGVPDLRIPGAAQMYDAIEIYKTQALEGKRTPKEAVDAIAADWEKIINQRGIERMRDAYVDTITPHRLLGDNNSSQ